MNLHPQVGVKQLHSRDCGSDSDLTEQAALRINFNSLEAKLAKKQMSAFKRSKAPAKELEGMWDVFFDIHTKSKQPPRIVSMLM